MGKHTKTDGRPAPERLKGKGGYCDAPADKRFQPGVCPNPKGRPAKQQLTEVDAVMAELVVVLNTKVPANGPGGEIEVRAWSIAMRRLTHEAINNPAVALKLLKLRLEHARQSPPGVPGADDPLGEDDEALLRAHERKVARSLAARDRLAVAAEDKADE